MCSTMTLRTSDTVFAHFVSIHDDSYCSEEQVATGGYLALVLNAVGVVRSAWGDADAGGEGLMGDGVVRLPGHRQQMSCEATGLREVW
jgi:hypothetical protein